VGIEGCLISITAVVRDAVAEKHAHAAASRIALM
jgi:hypothetical protein